MHRPITPAALRLVPPELRQAAQVLPWQAEKLAIRPFVGFYAFNPSIHYDPTDGVWRCLMRNADYHAPHGIVHANMKRGGKVTTRNVMVELDPSTWEAIKISEMAELDGLPRNTSAGAQGYEDLRLFRTERDGLVAIATTMMLRPAPEQKQEMVICRLAGAEDDYAIIGVDLLRGPWNDVPQKNWAPFDGTYGIRLLYSIERGVVFDGHGPIDAAPAAELEPPRPVLPPVRYNGGIETRMTNPVHAVARADGSMRAPEPKVSRGDWSAPGLRGGSQLVSLGDGTDAWLGLGHEMTWKGQRKHYTHTWYLCNGRGVVLERSPAMKLSECGIEFAAGLALDDDRDRLVVSFGTEDQDSWLATTRLSAVLDLLRPVPAKGGA